MVARDILDNETVIESREEEWIDRVCKLNDPRVIVIGSDERAWWTT
jgi:hypothetical protein